jgi:hypothetical protein
MVDSTWNSSKCTLIFKTKPMKILLDTQKEVLKYNPLYQSVNERWQKNACKKDTQIFYNLLIIGFSGFQVSCLFGMVFS